MKIEKNVGSLDRVIRMILALVFTTLYFTGTITGAFGVVLLVLAAVFAVTSAIGFCPLYMLFKLSTNK